MVVLGGTVDVDVGGTVVVVVVGGTVIVVRSNAATGGLELAGTSAVFHHTNDRTPRTMPTTSTTRNLNAKLDTGGTG